MTKPTSQPNLRPRPLSAEEINELYLKAKSLFGTIVGLTETPAEGMEIVCMIHLLMYLNYGDPSTNVDAMLSTYVKNFKNNWDAHQSATKSEMN